MRWLLSLYLPAATALILVALASVYLKVSIVSLTRDIAVVAGVHPFTGLISNIGILLWCAAAAICLFSSSILRHRNRIPEGAFLLWSGMMSLGLLLDDFFMFHDYLAPKHLGIDEKPVYVVYACLTAIYLARHLRVILQTDYLFLVAALTLFAVSMAVDVLPHSGGRLLALAEDGSKLLGISSWFAYQVRISRAYLQKLEVLDHEPAVTLAAGEPERVAQPSERLGAAARGRRCAL